MWRLARLLIALLSLAPAGLGETIRVTTWNLEWFPSGSPTSPGIEAEEANIRAAAKAIAAINPDVLLLQEVRDWDTCQKLCSAIPSLQYQVLICSAFKDEFAGGIGRQQVAILAKKPAFAAFAERWTSKSGVDPPRGYVFANVPFGTKNIAFYSVHLKSNLVRSSNARDPLLNIAKRELAAEQLISHCDVVTSTVEHSLDGIVVGGDFNTNRDQDMFVSERTLDLFEKAGFTDPFRGIPLAKRVTHPGKGRYPDATFDYLLSSKHLSLTGPPELLRADFSDHLAVTCEYRLPELTAAEVGRK